MVAGLPGIGVGTLFYVLTALSMPVRELGRTLRGDFSLARWRLAVMQFCFAIAIIASVALADRVLVTVVREGTVSAVTPARIINEGFATKAPDSILAAPVMATMLLLAVVLLTTEAVRVGLAGVRQWRSRRPLRGRREPVIARLVEDEP